jgi:uncharacterized membrane protein
LTTVNLCAYNEGRKQEVGIMEITGKLSTGKVRRIAGAAALAAALAVPAAVTHAVSLDHYGSAYFGTAYGISIGSDTHYCSIDIAWPPVTCESAS